MKIKYHPMDEKPVKSCEVIICTKWADLRLYPFSYKHYKFGIRDSEDPNEITACDESLYYGWIYADELDDAKAKMMEAQEKNNARRTY